MTDKEFKRLSRSQLVDIIYQFQLKVEELTQENQNLSAALEDKRLRITRAGNIAEAALEVNNVMQSAQNAAQQYLDEIRTLYSEIDEECQSIRSKAVAEAEALVQQAKIEADEIRIQAQNEAKSIMDKASQKENADSELEKILSEYGSLFRKR